VFVWKAGTAQHVNTAELGRHGRYRTNLWSYAGVNTLIPCASAFTPLAGVLPAGQDTYALRLMR
jgi:hypothetical protein